MPKQNTQNSAFLQVRVPRDLRTAFMHAAKQEDDSASRLVRQWIRDYIQEHQSSDKHSKT